MPQKTYFIYFIFEQRKHCKAIDDDIVLTVERQFKN